MRYPYNGFQMDTWAYLGLKTDINYSFDFQKRDIRIVYDRPEPKLSLSFV